MAAGLEREIDRVGEVWNDGSRRLGGPYPAGEACTAVDGFYAPVAVRIQSYGLTLDPVSVAYVDRLLNTRSMREWYADALKETLRDQPHDDEIAQVGRVLEDLRAR